MIAIDTSALMSVLLREPDWERCGRVLANETRVVMSAGTLAERLIVPHRRNLGALAETLIGDLRIEIDAVRGFVARQVAAAHAKWGKGVHPAGLNFDDRFANELACCLSVPLLFVGNDFARTDLRGVW